jgi:hypothetical protein
LAARPPEGHEVIRSSINLEDIIARRAIILSMAQINAEWSRKLLEKVGIEDSQWVIRSTATQILDYLQSPNPYIPHLLPPPAETPWLIKFASKNGTGISPAQPATEVLLLALKKGSLEERLGAMSYLSQVPEDRVIEALQQIIFSEHGLIIDTALTALWLIEATR